MSKKKYETVSDDAKVQAKYEELRSQGYTHETAKGIAIPAFKVPPYHNHFSPLHPRRNRGRGY